MSLEWGGDGRKLPNLGNLGKENGKFGEFKPKFAIFCEKQTILSQHQLKYVLIKPKFNQQQQILAIILQKYAKISQNQPKLSLNLAKNSQDQLYQQQKGFFFGQNIGLVKRAGEEKRMDANKIRSFMYKKQEKNNYIS